MSSRRHERNHPYNNVMTGLQEQENYLRMLFLVFDVGASAKRSILTKHLIKNGLNSLEDFIDKNQHDIYHYFDNKMCCQCKTNMSSIQKILLPNQIELIFDINCNQRKQGHHYGKSNRFCCLKAANISLNELDFTLLRFFIINFCDDLIWDDCLQSYNNNFETFLDREKHNIYHMWKSNTACCLCRTGFVQPKQCIQTDHQFHLMFQFTKNNCNNDTCGYYVWPGLTYDKLKNDDKLLFINLTNAFCPLRKAIEVITIERNNLAHMSQLRLDQVSFIRSWKEVSAAIKQIASSTDTFVDIREKIRNIKTQHFDAGLYLQKLEKMLQENRNSQDVPQQIENIVLHMKERLSQIEKKVQQNTEAVQQNIEAVQQNTEALRKNTAATENVYALFGLLIEGNVSNKDQIEIKTQGGKEPPSSSQIVTSAVWTSAANLIGWFMSSVRKILFNKDEDKDSFKCGPCQSEFERLQDFCAHIVVCEKRTKRKKCYGDSIEKSADQYVNVTVKGMGEKWEKQTVEYSKENTNGLNVNGAEVVSGELGSVVFWIKSSTAFLSSRNSLDSLINRFLKNLFRTCPAEENKTIPVEISVDIFEEISDVDEEGDIYHCGRCNYECSSFTSFLRHKTDRCQVNQNNSDPNTDMVPFNARLAEHVSFPSEDCMPESVESKEIQDTRFKQKCDVCDKKPSVYWCHGCQRCMCQDCYIQHTESKDTKYHIVQHEQDAYSLDFSFKVNVKVIRDIKVLHDDVLVIADMFGKQLVTCDITGQKQQTISLPGVPWCIAIVDNNTVAVTVCTNTTLLKSPTKVNVTFCKTVVIVDIRQRHVIQHINVNVGCYGILYRDNQLFVGCDDYTIKVMKMSGKTTRTISVRVLSGKDRTIKVMNMSRNVTRTIPVGVIPWYICGGEAGRIYYTDYVKLYCIDKVGNILFTFSDTCMSRPWGITTDDEGHVLIICYESNNVLRTSPDCKQSQVMITRISASTYWSSRICYNSLSKLVVVGRDHTVYLYKKV